MIDREQIPYCTDAELYSIAKEMAVGNLKLAALASIEWRDENLKKTALLPLESFDEAALMRLAPYFAKAYGEVSSNMDPGLRRVGNCLHLMWRSFLSKMGSCSGWGSIYVFQLSNKLHVKKHCVQFIITLIIVSFSSGLDSAILLLSSIALWTHQSMVIVGIW